MRGGQNRSSIKKTTKKIYGHQLTLNEKQVEIEEKIMEYFNQWKK